MMKQGVILQGKKICLSLAAVVALSSSSLVANTSLTEALTANSSFGGDIRFMYTNGNNTNVRNAPHNDDVTGQAAVELNYKTGELYGFKLGLSGRAAWDLRLHNEDNGSEDDTRNTITSTDLTQLYLEYGYSKSAIKVGRQYITTPLLFSTTGPFEFIVMDNFDAVDIKIGDIEDTIIQLTYVDRWNKKFGNDDMDTPIGIWEDVDYDGGLWSLYATNNSYKPLKFQAQVLRAGEQQDGLITNGDAPRPTNGDYVQYFAQADYKLPISFPLTFGLQYGGVHFDEKQIIDDDRAQLFGAQLSTNISGVTLAASYNTVSDDNDWVGTAGDRPDNVPYTGGYQSKSMYAGTDAFSLSATKKFDFGLWALLKYIHGEQSDEGIANSKTQIGDFDELSLMLSYDLSFILKGLSTDVWVSYVDFSGDYARIDANKSGDNESTYGRYFLTYKF